MLECDLGKPNGPAIFNLLMAAANRHQDGRTDVRYPIVRPVLIQLNNSTYRGLSREISHSGIGLVHHTRLRLERCFLVISFADCTTSLIPVRVVWCRQLGEAWFISGAQFLSDDFLNAPGAMTNA